jgi:hypothetical protein
LLRHLKAVPHTPNEAVEKPGLAASHGGDQKPHAKRVDQMTRKAGLTVFRLRGQNQLFVDGRADNLAGET